MSTTGFGLKRTVFPVQVASVTSTGSTTPRGTSVPRELGETERFGVTTHPNPKAFGPTDLNCREITSEMTQRSQPSDVSIEDGTGST